jgi:predicted Zn-ribbon and HTH transcriptional regulator
MKNTTMAAKSPHAARASTRTPRQAIRDHLREEALSARDLSARVGLPEREIVPHLEHLARSLRAAGERLEVEQSRCLHCGFVFRERSRLGKPSGCPRCREPHVTAPIFRIGSRR